MEVKVYTWEKPKALSERPPDQRAVSAVRPWAAQILNAVRRGADTEYLYEIWVDGNEVEQEQAREVMAERDQLCTLG